MGAPRHHRSDEGAILHLSLDAQFLSLDRTLPAESAARTDDRNPRWSEPAAGTHEVRPGAGTTGVAADSRLSDVRLDELVLVSTVRTCADDQ